MLATRSGAFMGADGQVSSAPLPRGELEGVRETRRRGVIGALGLRRTDSKADPLSPEWVAL